MADFSSKAIKKNVTFTKKQMATYAKAQGKLKYDAPNDVKNNQVQKKRKK